MKPYFKSMPGTRTLWTSCNRWSRQSAVPGSCVPCKQQVVVLDLQQKPTKNPCSLMWNSNPAPSRTSFFSHLSFPHFSHLANRFGTEKALKRMWRLESSTQPNAWLEKMSLGISMNFLWMASGVLYHCPSLKLVGGFNPFEKYWSNWIISSKRNENTKYLKPPPRKLLCAKSMIIRSSSNMRWIQPTFRTSDPISTRATPGGHFDHAVCPELVGPQFCHALRDVETIKNGSNTMTLFSSMCGLLMFSFEDNRRSLASYCPQHDSRFILPSCHLACIWHPPST